MLNGNLSNHFLLGLAQAGLAAVMVIAAMLLARRRQIHVERETLIALLRGLAQVIAVGFVFIVLLRGPRWTSGIILACMMVVAAMTSARRAKSIPGAFQTSLCAIAVGAGLIIVVMVLSGVIARTITALVPVGSMLIASAMNSNALALDRFRAEVESHVGEIEAALALGASPAAAVARYVQISYRASLIPPLNNLRYLGHRLDSRADDRHAALRLATALCGGISVRGDRHDVCRVGIDLLDQHRPDSRPRLYPGAAVAAAGQDGLTPDRL